MHMRHIHVNVIGWRLHSEQRNISHLMITQQLRTLKTNLHNDRITSTFFNIHAQDVTCPIPKKKRKKSTDQSISMVNKLPFYTSASHRQSFQTQFSHTLHSISALSAFYTFPSLPAFSFCLSLVLPHHLPHH